MSRPHSSGPAKPGQSFQSYPGQYCQMCTQKHCQPWLDHCNQSIPGQFGQSYPGHICQMMLGVQIRASSNPVMTHNRSTECLPNSPFTRIIPRKTSYPRCFTSLPPRRFKPTEYRQRLNELSASILSRELRRLRCFHERSRALPSSFTTKGSDRIGCKTTSRRGRRGRSSSTICQHRVTAAFEEMLTGSNEGTASLSNELIRHLIDYTLAKNTPSTRHTQSVRYIRSRDGARVPTIKSPKSYRTHSRPNESSGNSMASVQRRQWAKPRKLIVANRSTRNKGHSTHASPRGGRDPSDPTARAADGLRALRVRATEVRYLSDVRKSLRGALGLCSDQPSPCKPLLERYHQHIREHHQCTASTMRDIQDDQAVQSASGKSRIGAMERQNYNIGFSPQTPRSSKTSRNVRASLSPRYSSVSFDTMNASSAGHSHPEHEPCTCPENHPLALLSKMQNLFSSHNKECVCLTSGIPIVHIIEDWLKLLPLRANYDKKDQEAKNNAVDYLQRNLKKKIAHENEWREIIENGFDLLPLWLPSEPTERAKFKEIMQEDLFQRFKQVVKSGLTQEEYFDAFIVAFVRRLAFDAKVNKVILVANLTAKLEEVAQMTPDTERYNVYLKTILQELAQWPIKYIRKSTEQAQCLANSLAGLQIDAPQEYELKNTKAWVQVTKDEIVSIIKSWYHTLPFKCEDNAGFDIDLISDLLADDIQTIYKKNNAEEIWDDLRNVVLEYLSVLLTPDKRNAESEKLVNKLIAPLYVQKIVDWFESVPFVPGAVRKEDFVDDLTNTLKYVNLIPSNELDVNKVAQTILKKLNEFTVSCDEGKKEPLALELAEALCELPKEKGFLHNMTDIISKWIDNLNFLLLQPDNKYELATGIAIDLNNILINKLAEEIWDIMHFAVLGKLRQLPVNMTDLEKATAAEELVNRLMAEKFYYSVLSWITSLPFTKDSHIDKVKHARGLCNHLKQVMDTEADCANIESGLKTTAMQWLTDLHVECSSQELERLAEGLVDILNHLPREKNIVRDAVRKLFKQIPLSEEKKPKDKPQYINDLAKKIEDKVKITKPDNYWHVIKVTAAKEIKDLVAKNKIGMVGYLGEKLAKDIINGMIYDAVSRFVHVVSFPPEQEKQDIICDLMNTLSDVASNTLPDQQKEAIKNNVLGELNKKNVLSTEDELEPLIDVLADKLNALPREKDLFYDIVRDWVKTIPFLEPPNGGLLKLTFNLIQQLKKICNGRPATKNCRENCINTILEVLLQQKLKCNNEQAKEFAKQLVDKLASLLFNETINQWVRSLPLKDNPPVDGDALLLKVQNVLRKNICEFQYDPENGKNPICNEILKILETLPIDCDQEDVENVRKVLAESLADELLKFPVIGDPGSRLILELTQMHPAYFDLTVDNIKIIVKKMTAKYEALTEKNLAKPELEKEIKKEIDTLINQLQIDNPAKTLLEGVIVSLSKVEMEDLVKKLMIKFNELNNEFILENENIIKQDIKNEINVLLKEKEQNVEVNAIERLANKLFQQIMISKDNLDKEKMEDELSRYRQIIKDWITQIPELQIITPVDIKLYEEICEVLLDNIKVLKEQKHGVKENIIDEIKQRLDEILQIKNIALEPSEKRKLIYKLVDKLNKNIMNGVVSVESIVTTDQNQNSTLVNENDLTENVSKTYNVKMRNSTFNEGYLTTHYKTKDFKARNILSYDNYDRFVESLHEIEPETPKIAIKTPILKLSGNIQVSTHDKIKDMSRVNAFKDQGTFVDPKIRNSLTDEIFSTNLQKQLKANKNPMSFNIVKTTERLENTSDVSCFSSFLQLNDGEQSSTSKVTLGYIDYKDLKEKNYQNCEQYEITEKLPDVFRNKENKSKTDIKLNALIGGFLDENDTTDTDLRHIQQSSNENNTEKVFTKDLSADNIDKNVQNLKQKELKLKIASDIKKAIQSILEQEVGNIAEVRNKPKNLIFTKQDEQKEPKLLRDQSNLLTDESSRNAKINVITKEIYNWIEEIPELKACDLMQDELSKLLNETLVAKLIDVELKDLSKIQCQKEIRDAVFAILNVFSLKQGKQINRKMKCILLEKLIRRLHDKCYFTEDEKVKQNATKIQDDINSFTELPQSYLPKRIKNDNLQENLMRTKSNVNKRTKESTERESLGYCLTPRICSSRKFDTKDVETMVPEIQIFKKNQGIERSLKDKSVEYINYQPEFVSDEALQKKKIEDICTTLIKKLITDQTQQHKIRNSILYNVRDRLDKSFFLTGQCIDSNTKQTLAESLIELVENKTKYIEKQTKLSNMFKRNIYQWFESNQNITITYTNDKSGKEKLSADLAKHLAKVVLENCDCNTFRERMLLIIKKKLNRALSESRGYLDSSTTQELAEDLINIVDNISKQLISLDQINTRKYTITIQDCLEDLPDIATDTLTGTMLIQRMTEKITAALKELDKEKINTTKRNSRIKCIIKRNLDIVGIENMKKQIENELTEKTVDGDRQRSGPINDVIVYDFEQTNTNFHHNTQFSLRSGITEQHSQNIIEFKRMEKNCFDLQSCVKETFDGYFKSIFNKDPDVGLESDVSQWLSDIPVMANVTETNTKLRKHICQTLATKLSQLETTESNDRYKRKMLYKVIKKYLDYAVDMINQNITLTEQNQWTEKIINQIAASIEKLESDESLTNNFEGLLLETETKKRQKCNNSRFITEPKIYFAHNITRFTTEPKTCFTDILQAERRYFEISKQIPVAINKKMLGTIAKNLDDIIKPLGHDVIYNKIFDLLVVEGGLLVKDADEFTSFIMKQAQKLALKAISDEIYLMNLVNQRMATPAAYDMTDTVTVGIEILPTHLKPIVNEKTVNHLMQDLSKEVNVLKNIPGGEMKIRENIRKKMKEIYGDLNEDELKRLESDIYRSIIEPTYRGSEQYIVNAAKAWTKNLPSHIKPIVNEGKMNQLHEELCKVVIALKDSPDGKTKIRGNIRQNLGEMYGDLEEDELNRLESDLYHTMVGAAAEYERNPVNAAKAWIKTLPAHIKPIVSEKKLDQLLKELSEDVRAFRNTPEGEMKIRHKIRENLIDMYGKLDQDEFKRLESDLYRTMVDAVKEQSSVKVANLLTKSLPSHIKPIVRESKMYQLLKELGEDVSTLKDIPGGEKKVQENIREKLIEIYGDLDLGELKKLQWNLFHVMVEAPNAARTWLKNLPSHIKPIVNESKVNQLLEELGEDISALRHTPGGEKKIRDNIQKKIREMYGELDEIEFKRLESDLYHIMVDSDKANSKQKILNKMNSWIKTLPSDIKPVVNESKINQLLEDLCEEVSIHKETPGEEKKIRGKIREKLVQLFGNLDEDKLESLESDLYNKIVEDSKQVSRNKSKSPAQYIEEWCDKLPIQGHSEEVKTIKQNLVSKLKNKISELNVNPDIFDDKDLYRDILLDEIQQEMLDIPRNQELDTYLPNLVQELVSNLLKARQSMVNGKAGKWYKSKLKNAAGNVLPIPCSLPTNEAADLEVLKDKIADAFMHLIIAEPCDTFCLFVESIFDDIQMFYNKILSYCPCAPDAHKLGEDLFETFLQVPVPQYELIKSEVEQAAVRDVINKWMQTLPLRQESGTETLHRHKLAALLAKKLYDMETENGHNPRFNVDREMSELITKFLKKVSLDNADQQIPHMTQLLISKLKDTENGRKFIQMKCKSCDERRCPSSGLIVSCQLEPKSSKERNLSLGTVCKRFKSMKLQTCVPSDLIQYPVGFPLPNRVRQSMKVTLSNEKKYNCGLSVSCQSAPRDTCRQPDKSLGTVVKIFKPFANMHQPSLTCKSCLNQQFCRIDTGCSPSHSFSSCCKIISVTPGRCNMSTSAHCLPPNATSMNPCEWHCLYRHNSSQTLQPAQLTSCGVGTSPISTVSQCPDTREYFGRRCEMGSGADPGTWASVTDQNVDEMPYELYAEDVTNRRERFGCRANLRNLLLRHNDRNDYSDGLNCPHTRHNCFQHNC